MSSAPRPNVSALQLAGLPVLAAILDLDLGDGADGRPSPPAVGGSGALARRARPRAGAGARAVGLQLAQPVWLALLVSTRRRPGRGRRVRLDARVAVLPQRPTRAGFRRPASSTSSAMHNTDTNIPLKQLRIYHGDELLFNVRTPTPTRLSAKPPSSSRSPRRHHQGERMSLPGETISDRAAPRRDECARMPKLDVDRARRRRRPG